MDAKLAIAFWLMSLASSGYEGHGFKISHDDADHRLTMSSGILQSAGKTVGAEMHFTYNFDQFAGHFNPVVDFSLATGGATWVGAGLYQQFDLDVGNRKFFAGFSFIPGLYMHGDGFDLGYPLEFRSGVELGYHFNNGAQMSLSYDHRSNAGLAKRNPGLESIAVRFSQRF